MTTHLSKSRTFPVAVDVAYDRVLAAPLPSVFSRRFLLLPRIRSVEGQPADWGAAAGQGRTITLADGGMMRETLTEVDRPRRFAYSISEITGMLKPLVTGAAGTWSFEAVGTGVRVTWTWDVEVTEPLGRYAMPVFARLWSGYARQAMEELEPLLLAP